ncbi:MAG: NUDIX domain-containing protein [Acidimicrobiales bacterium]
MPEVSVAAAVVVRRERSPSASVLLVQRGLRTPDGREMAFAGAWVVPGGVVDPQDRVRDGETVAPGPAIRRAAIREVREEVGVELRDEDLTSLWEIDTETPTGRRYRVHYFEAVLPEGQRPTVDGEELTGYRWRRPSEAVTAAEQGQIPIPPGTLETLERLAGRDRDDPGPVERRGGGR